MEPSSFNRILIVRLSALGDVINTLPALAALRRNFPKSFIGWVVEDKAQEILAGQPDLNEIFVFRRKDWQIKLTNPLRLLRLTRDVPEFVRQIQQRKFDIALDFQGNLKSGVITYLSGARTRVGFNRAATREFNHLFLNRSIPLAQPRINRVERNLVLLQSLGLDTSHYQVKMPIDKAAGQYRTEFAQRYFKPQVPVVVMHPGTSRFGVYKRWPSEYYAALGDRLAKELKVNLLISAGPGEEELTDEIRQKMRQPVITGYQTSPLGRFTALLKGADLFIGSDSAPLHLANLLGTPVVALFGPKDPVIYGPGHHPNAVIIRAELKCSPCRKRTCARPDCMRLITVDEVFNAAQKVLSKK